MREGLQCSYKLMVYTDLLWFQGVRMLFLHIFSFKPREEEGRFLRMDYTTELVMVKRSGKEEDNEETTDQH